MSKVQVSWDDANQTIARYDFDYGWTWAELEAANDAIEALIADADREVAVIAVQNYPQHYLPPNPLSKISAMLPRRPQKIGLTVIVTHSSLVNGVLQLMVKLYPSASHLRFAHTVADARAMIQRYKIQQDY